MRTFGRAIRCQQPLSSALLTVPLIVAASFAAPAAAAQVQSYAVEWFSLASYSQPGDCPEGMNPPTRDQYPKDLQLLGYSPEQIRQIMEDWVSNDQPRGGFRQ